MSFIFRRDRTRIVVNHLTRMQHGYICVAGIDPRTGEHIRPVLERDRLRYTELTRHGGPFDIACIVDLGRTSYVGHAPEVEDYRFVLRNARGRGQVPAQEFWNLLKGVSKTRLRDIFGDDLYQQGPTFALDEGKGGLRWAACCWRGPLCCMCCLPVTSGSASTPTPMGRRSK